tara:strand:- start:279 stop:1022 length:744 start_codon:yes stop_codon:yes gene_type:complete
MVLVASDSLLDSALRILDGSGSSSDSLAVYNYNSNRFSNYKVRTQNKDSDGIAFNGLKSLESGASFLYGINHDDNRGTIVSLSDSSIISGNNYTYFNLAHKKGGERYFIWIDEQNLVSNIPLKTSSAPGNIVVGSESGTISGKGYHDIYFIVSKNRITELENLIYKHERVQSANKSAAVRMTKQIRDLLDGLVDPGKRKRYANRLQKAVELGMSYRGDEDEKLKKASMSELVDGEDIAIKRITIEYR